MDDSRAELKVATKAVLMAVSRVIWMGIETVETRERPSAASMAEKSAAMTVAMKAD